MNLAEYLHFVSYAKSLEELWDGHCRQMAKYGFTKLLYGFTRYKTQTSLGDPEDFIILTNHGKEYLDGFLRDGLYFDAPMLKWALQNEGAASWKMTQEMLVNGELSPREKAVIEFNRSKGVGSGFTVSFNSVSARSKGAISLSGCGARTQDDVDAIWDEHGNDILLMNNVAHLKIITLPYNAPNRALTKRQREALEWVGDGKTTQDIAVLMGLTVATVEKHLRLARESLAVETTAQAVLKASLHNQMFIMGA